MSADNNKRKKIADNTIEHCIENRNSRVYTTRMSMLTGRSATDAASTYDMHACACTCTRLAQLAAVS